MLPQNDRKVASLYTEMQPAKHVTKQEKTEKINTKY